MTVMDAFVPWLREQIEEDRRIAKAAYLQLNPATQEWREDYSRGMQVRDAKDHLVVTHSWPNEIAHIVRHDPRAALAQCDAHEAILREHRPYGEWLRDEFPAWAPSAERSCVGCGFDNQEERRTLDVNDCPTLRALALAYRHRPGFCEEWVA